MSEHMSGNVKYRSRYIDRMIKSCSHVSFWWQNKRHKYAVPNPETYVNLGVRQQLKPRVCVCMYVCIVHVLKVFWVQGYGGIWRAWGLEWDATPCSLVAQLRIANPKPAVSLLQHETHEFTWNHEFTWIHMDPVHDMMNAMPRPIYHSKPFQTYSSSLEQKKSHHYVFVYVYLDIYIYIQIHPQNYPIYDCGAFHRIPRKLKTLKRTNSHAVKKGCDAYQTNCIHLEIVLGSFWVPASLHIFLYASLKHFRIFWPGSPEVHRHIRLHLWPSTEPKCSCAYRLFMSLVRLDTSCTNQGLGWQLLNSSSSLPDRRLRLTIAPWSKIEQIKQRDCKFFFGPLLCHVRIASRPCTPCAKFAVLDSRKCRGQRLHSTPTFVWFKLEVRKKNKKEQEPTCVQSWKNKDPVGRPQRYCAGLRSGLASASITIGRVVQWAPGLHMLLDRKAKKSAEHTKCTKWQNGDNKWTVIVDICHSLWLFQH